MQIDLTQIIITVITLILVPTLELIFLKVNKYISGKVENETIEKYVLLTSELVKNAVITTNQTFVNELKLKGEFTWEKAAKAFETTKEAVVKQLSDEAKEVLNTVFNDYNSYVNSLIEKEVSYNKISVPAHELFKVGF